MLAWCCRPRADCARKSCRSCSKACSHGKTVLGAGRPVRAASFKHMRKVALTCSPRTMLKLEIARTLRPTSDAEIVPEYFPFPAYSQQPSRYGRELPRAARTVLYVQHYCIRLLPKVVTALTASPERVQHAASCGARLFQLSRRSGQSGIGIARFSGTL